MRTSQSNEQTNRSVRRNPRDHARLSCTLARSAKNWLLVCSFADALPGRGTCAAFVACRRSRRSGDQDIGEMGVLRRTGGRAFSSKLRLPVPMITAASVTFSLASVALSIASPTVWVASAAQLHEGSDHPGSSEERLYRLLSTVSSLCVPFVVRTTLGSSLPSPSRWQIILALISLIMLIYFVHHVSTSIQGVSHRQRHL